MPGLERFVDAQDAVYATALRELRAGYKRTHWIWYVFPQLAGLGLSERSRIYGIASLDEARNYLAHPVLGPRLVACAQAMLDHADASALDILGSPDDAKFRSSMTLFGRVPGADPIYKRALDQFFGGREDPRTLDMLGER